MERKTGFKNDIKNEIRNIQGIQGHKRYYSIFARLGKHYCPYCYNLLQLKRKKQIVNSESEEAKDFDFTLMFEGSNLHGNIEFTWDLLYCKHCDLEISVRDMKNYERERKKADGYIDFDAIRMRNTSFKKKAYNRLHIIIFCIICVVFLFVFYYIKSRV